MRLLSFIFFLVFIISGCASNRSKTQDDLRNAYIKNEFETCHKLLEEENPQKNKNSKLLYYLDKGRIFHDQGRFFLATKMLEMAAKIDQELYTVSLSKKGLSYVSNDNVDIFYGSSYERSMIHFYLALNYYQLFQKGVEESYTEEELMAGTSEVKNSDKKKIVAEKVLSAKEKQNHLIKARASILNWDSMLNTLKNDRMGKSVFKNDLLAKILGGFIHEAFRKSSEDQIALQLYKDAREILTKNYSGYKTFNGRSVEFKQNFESFSNMEVEDVVERFIKKSYYFEDLEKYLTWNILRLTKEIRPQELSSLTKRYNVSDSMLKDLKQLKERPNVRVFIEAGMIPQKVGKRVNIGFEGFLENVEDPKTRESIRAVGVPVLAMFMANILGLVPDENNWSMPGAMLGVQVASLAVSHVGFSFELPEIVNTPLERKILIEVTDSNGKIIAQSPLKVISPINDIAEEAVAEDSVARYWRTGTRVGMKHITAILASFATYKLIANKNPNMEFIAKNAAVAQYIALSKGIEMTEKADIRYWSTLPQDIRFTDLFLPEGSYTIKAKVYLPTDEKVFKVFDLGVHKIVSKDDNQILNYRLKNLAL